MDPNLFHLDWERTGEVLTAVVVLSLVIERALAPLFENRWWLETLDKKFSKELIAFGVASAACISVKFDALSMIVLTSKTGPFGELVTGAVIAGGAKGSIKLFRDVLDFKSTALREAEGATAAPRPAVPSGPVPDKTIEDALKKAAEKAGGQ